MVNAILQRKQKEGFLALLHDTHHRVYTSAHEILKFHLHRFDGVLAFGEAIRKIYHDGLGIERTWTFHEAADVSVFKPQEGDKTTDVVWIGNWGDEERTQELTEFLVGPARALCGTKVVAHGVRYPEEAVKALRQAGIDYRGYLPNLSTPRVYGQSRLALHVPRRQYTNGLSGIPTIRVFEALACGIPLLCSPWNDIEHLFRPGEDYIVAADGKQMAGEIEFLLGDEAGTRANRGQRSGDDSQAAHLRASRRAAHRDLRGSSRMKIFVFGSSITSCYWNGAATYYRGIYQNLAALGHEITFAEPDIYGRQQNRDRHQVNYAEVIVYRTPDDIDGAARQSRRRRSGRQAQRRGSGLTNCWRRGCSSAARRAPRWRSGTSTRRRPWLASRPIPAIPFADSSRNTISSSLTAAALPSCGITWRWERATAIRFTTLWNPTRTTRSRPIPRSPVICCSWATVCPTARSASKNFFLRAAELAPEMSFILGGEGWSSKSLPPNVR